MADYEAKRTQRIDRLKARAARLTRAADAASERARAISSQIPLGQPVLVGHHSQRRHERDLERIRNRFARAVKLRDEAAAVLRRVRAAESNRAISSDDPEAVDKLRAKLAKLEADRALMVAANKAARSKAPQEALVALGLSSAMVTQILTPDFMGRIGFPDYVLRNSAGEASRLRKRIAAMEARSSAPAPEAVELPNARIEEADNRVRIFFSDRPSEALRASLKGSGFRWAPSVGAWQRHASPGAWYAAKRLLGASERGAA
ncbi:MAG: DUF3560 domain-containing protein [Labilithrix sp.]|nr:DUF3560 domain-containing protein [Labilithrix sp.]